MSVTSRWHSRTRPAAGCKWRPARQVGGHRWPPLLSSPAPFFFTRPHREVARRARAPRRAPWRPTALPVCFCHQKTPQAGRRDPGKSKREEKCHGRERTQQSRDGRRVAAEAGFGHPPGTAWDTRKRGEPRGHSRRGRRGGAASVSPAPRSLHDSKRSVREGAWPQAGPGPLCADACGCPTQRAGQVTVAPGEPALGLDEDQAETYSSSSLSGRKPFSNAALPTISRRPRERRPRLAARAGAAARPVPPEPAARLWGQRGATASRRFLAARPVPAARRPARLPVGWGDVPG